MHIQGEVEDLNFSSKLLIVSRLQTGCSDVFNWPRNCIVGYVNKLYYSYRLYGIITDHEDFAKRTLRTTSANDAGPPLRPGGHQDSRHRVRGNPAGKIFGTHSAGNEKRPHRRKCAWRQGRVPPAPFSF